MNKLNFNTLDWKYPVNKNGDFGFYKGRFLKEKGK